MQIGNPTVIDIAIRTTLCPMVGVSREVSAHVFMNLLLKIDAKRPVCPNHEVRTDSNVIRHIACRIADLSVATVVGYTVIGSLECGVDQLPSEAVAGILGTNETGP